MEAQKKIEALIWWHAQTNSSELWKEYDGFDITFENWKETTLAKIVVKLFEDINCLEIVSDLEENARKSAIRWQLLQDELWNVNYDHEQS